MQNTYSWGVEAGVHMQIVALHDGRVHCMSGACSAHSFFYTSLYVPAQPPLPVSDSILAMTAVHTHTHTNTHANTLHVHSQSASLTHFFLSLNTHAHSFLRLRHILSASLWVNHHYLERVPVFGHSMPPSQCWTEQPRHRLLVVTQLSQTCLITAVANVKALK